MPIVVHFFHIRLSRLDLVKAVLAQNESLFDRVESTHNPFRDSGAGGMAVNSEAAPQPLLMEKGDISFAIDNLD